MDITVENAFIILKKYLENTNKDKFDHSIRVALTSKILAKKWDIPIEDAIIASLLHDIGKSMNKKEMLSLCIQNSLTMYDFEIFENPVALHGKVSALLFESEFADDEIDRFNSISNAISSHVTGSKAMDNLSKIVFIADNIEPKRGNDILSKVQSGKLNSIDECIKMIIRIKIEKAHHRGLEHNPLLNCTLDSLDER